MECFVLDFKGKVKIPSEKNFILTDDKEEEEYMLFGKIHENTYVLDVKWPLSLYQALAISITSLQ